MPAANASTCRVCGCDSGALFSTSAANYSRCSQCGTVQKLLTAAEYAALDRGYDPGNYLDGSSERDIRDYLGVEDMRAMLTRVCDDYRIDSKGASFLDIGCGMGGYMLAARDLGMTVRGFEPSANHGRVATEVLHLPVDKDYFSPDKVGDQRFDLILLSHVIEHIYEPVRFTEEVLSVLRPGGVVIMVTPNAAATIARLTGPRWPMLIPIDHVTMLSPSAVPYLLPTGFAAKIRTSEYPFEFAATFGSVAKSALRSRGSADAEPSASHAPRLMSSTNWRGSIMRTVLTAASVPAYLYSGLTNRRAALIFTITRES